MITTTIEDFFFAHSLDQTMDLALGQADCDTKSLLKDLLLNLVEECTAFVLYKIRKRRIRLGDVEAVVGNALLKAFADALQIKGKIHPKSFDAFNKLFVKHVKEKVRSSICAMHDPAASFVLQICEMNRVDSVLSHALRVIKELLVWRCKEHRQRKRRDAEVEQNVFNKQQAVTADAGNFQTVEQKAIQNPKKEGGKHRFGKSFSMDHHRRFKLLPVLPEEPALEEAAAEVTDERDFIPENQESEIKMVDEFISEELSELTKEKESELKLVDEFISEELSDMTKEKESELKLVDEFISEELSEMTKEKESELKLVDEVISEELSEVTVKEISEQQSLEIPGFSVDMIQSIENAGLRDGAAPLPIAKPKGVGELGDEEREVTEVQYVITEESNLSTGINLTDDEEESEFTGVDKAIISVCKEEILKPAKEPTIFKSFLSSVGKPSASPLKSSEEHLKRPLHQKQAPESISGGFTSEAVMSRAANRVSDSQSEQGVKFMLEPDICTLTYQTMSLGGRFVPLARMWGIQMSGSNIGHHDIYMPHMPVDTPVTTCGTIASLMLSSLMPSGGRSRCSGFVQMIHFDPHQWSACGAKLIAAATKKAAKPADSKHRTQPQRSIASVPIRTRKSEPQKKGQSSGGLALRVRQVGRSIRVGIPSEHQDCLEE
ncbi:hypothetical protein CRENBAI_001047 [Crenichthys baileyi]|uniref:Uncharacterized protein n=1 Tax=Crenichthys baileyi TaxID=28760 RepID=A0AAV9RNS9_9TELE